MGMLSPVIWGNPYGRAQKTRCPVAGSLYSVAIISKPVKEIMYKIIGAVVAVLLVIGGAIYYFASASNPSAMSRDKAASLILAYEKQNNPMEFVMSNPGNVSGSFSTTKCPSGLPPNTTLFDEGYLSMVAYGYITHTSKDAPYVDAAHSNSSEYRLFAAYPSGNVNVSGITSTGNNLLQAEFTQTFELTPIGIACGMSATQNLSAVLQLYDDGWRVVQIGSQ